MAQQGDFDDGAVDQNYTALLNGFPELWADILKRVPEENRLRHVPLVSRRFSEACQEPSLWPELHVLHSSFRTKAQWGSFLRWLAVRAPGLQTLVFGGRFNWAVPDADAWERRSPELLALLTASAPQLRSLEHWYPYRAPLNPASALPAELGRLSRLTSLTLGFRRTRVTMAQVDAMVQTLPSLQHLSLDGPLTGGFPVGITSSCSQLRCLETYAADLGNLPQELGRLTALTRLSLEHSGVASLPDSISQLVRLSELELYGNEGLALPPELAACRQLTRLTMDSDATSPVLADLQSLQYLNVSAPEWPHETYWPQLTALTELRLICDYHGSFLAGLGDMIGLRHLLLECSDLGALPVGPYLSRLESLVTFDCNFPRGVPAALAAATQLRLLRVLDSGFNRDPFVYLTAADVAVLSSLAALTTLTLTRPAGMENHEWDERLAQLQAAFVAQGRAPPAISNFIW